MEIMHFHNHFSWIKLLRTHQNNIVVQISHFWIFPPFCFSLSNLLFLVWHQDVLHANMEWPFSHRFRSGYKSLELKIFSFQLHSFLNNKFSAWTFFFIESNENENRQGKENTNYCASVWFKKEYTWEPEIIPVSTLYMHF